jgi:hypothetical protein
MYLSVINPGDFLVVFSAYKTSPMLTGSGATLSYFALVLNLL